LTEEKTIIEKRIEDTEEQIKRYMEKSLNTMLTKNKQRGDCWRNSGLLGQFVEIHSMYFRLRNLIWDMKDHTFFNQKEYEEWKLQVINALEDLRNFTLLGEMCVIDKNFDGGKYIDEKL